jgi:lipopolysaccharide biosynthesis regulator YciM
MKDIRELEEHKYDRRAKVSRYKSFVKGLNFLKEQQRTKGIRVFLK